MPTVLLGVCLGAGKDSMDWPEVFIPMRLMEGMVLSLLVRSKGAVMPISRGSLKKWQTRHAWLLCMSASCLIVWVLLVRAGI